VAGPIASRPYMPGYGIQRADEGSGLLPWSFAEDRLRASHDYWLATVWPDGRPHVMPVWGVWRDDQLWFSSSGSSRKTRNLAHDSRCTATTDNPLEPVVVEGRAEQIADADAITAFTASVNSKYSTDYGVEFFAGNACLRLTPAWAFALSAEDFIGSPTRWQFGDAG
jgi:PPOX class probable F420-dependent enzyme